MIVERHPIIDNPRFPPVYRASPEGHAPPESYTRLLPTRSNKNAAYNESWKYD